MRRYEDSLEEMMEEERDYIEEKMLKKRSAIFNKNKKNIWQKKEQS